MPASTESTPLRETGPGRKRGTAADLWSDSFSGARNRPADHVIRGRRGADVLHVVHLIGGLKDDAARADAPGLAALKRFEGAFLDDQQLFVLMLMRRVRRLSRVQRRDMNLELVER